ncbi:DNA polymerase III polC-type [Chlamydia trachomatis]|nr:DNA polymerase III polC-type [Chlamydia trachomatis]
METKLELKDFIEIINSKSNHIFQKLERNLSKINIGRAGTILGYAEKSAFSLAKKLNEIQTRLYLNEHPNEYEFSMYSNTFLDFLATKTSGVKKTTGQHPGGIIVILNDLEIEEFTPINFPANDDNSD